MLDTLKACLTALQTEAAAVMYNRESEGTFLFVLSDHEVYILDENLESGMIRFEFKIPSGNSRLFNSRDESV